MPSLWLKKRIWIFVEGKEDFNDEKWRSFNLGVGKIGFSIRFWLKASNIIEKRKCN